MATVPPDATVFRSNGRELYLYLGSLELRALQREWGLTRAFSDDDDAWSRKQIEFSQRLDGSSYEDKVAMLRIALARWAEDAGVKLTERVAADILDKIGLEAGEKRRSDWGDRIIALHAQLVSDSSGGDAGGPKEPAPTSTTSSAPDSSIPNGS